MSTPFDDAFAAIIGNEGGLSISYEDPGNWTGGRVGLGACRGTKYGISAARYPDLDISKLTLDQAKALACRDYWSVYHCNEFDPRIGFQIFDAAYNGGHAAQWLQQAAGVHPDGEIGPVTIAAVKTSDPLKIIMRFDSLRLSYLASLDVWPSFGRGWTRRIASNLMRGAA